MFADVKMAGDLVQGERLGQIVPDIVQDGGDPEEILVSDGFAGGGGVEGGGQTDEQVQKGDRLTNVAAEASVVFVALQGLEKLNDLSHLFGIELRTAESYLPKLGKISLGRGQLGQGLVADVEHIPGVKAGGHGPVEGVFPDEVEGPTAKRVNLIVDKNVSRTGQGEEKLIVVMEMEPAHIPGVIVIQL